MGLVGQFGLGTALHSAHPQVPWLALHNAALAVCTGRKR
jgi:hypothetical protein